MTQSTRDEDSFLYGANSPFIEALYQSYRQDPQSVSDDWRQFFFSLGNGSGQDDRPPQWKKRKDRAAAQSQESSELQKI